MRNFTTELCPKEPIIDVQQMGNATSASAQMNMIQLRFMLFRGNTKARIRENLDHPWRLRGDVQLSYKLKFW
ncbi:hypothetical protein ACK334_19785 [Aeromonas veronii]